MDFNLDEFRETFDTKLVEAWLAQHPREERGMAIDGSRFRHSWAGNCSRRIQYELTGIEPTEPIAVSGQWIMEIGQFVHDEWQAALVGAFPKAVAIEVAYPSPHVDGSYHLDAQITFRKDKLDHVVVVEIKSINGAGYRRAVGAQNQPATGPRYSAKLQAALNAHATPNCIGALIIYVATEAVSVRMAMRHDLSEERRFLTSWWLSPFEIEALAVPEERRINNLFAWIDEHPNTLAPRKIPDPEIPDNHRVTNPMDGTWTVSYDGRITDVGRTWHCDYCPFQTRCTNDGAAGPLVVPGAG